MDKIIDEEVDFSPQVEITKETLKTIRWADREDIITLLEGYSIVCFDNESTETLKEALISNIEDGTIPDYEVEDF